ncbi:ABC transporter substrate-binding protein [Neorhizobium sp. LjRoot104]
MTPSDCLNPTRRSVLISLGTGVVALTLPQVTFAQARGPVPKFGLSTFPPTIKPFDNTGGAANTVKLMLYRCLMGYDATGKLVTELAESVEWTDPTTAVFKLRQNAVFHDGSPVTAADVAYSLNEITKDGSTAYLKSDLKIIVAVEAVNDKTVHIKLKAPSAIFLDLMASYCCPVISKKSTDSEIIGAGPFTLKSSEKNVYIEVARFKDFYQADQPKVDGIRFVAYADENRERPANELWRG